MHTIIIEPTANPNVMKFVADYTLIPGSLELDRTSDISEIPLAQELSIILLFLRFYLC